MKKDIQNNGLLEFKIMWKGSSLGLTIKDNWLDRQELVLHCGLSRLREKKGWCPVMSLERW